MYSKKVVQLNLLSRLNLETGRFTDRLGCPHATVPYSKSHVEMMSQRRFNRLAVDARTPLASGEFFHALCTGQLRNLWVIDHQQLYNLWKSFPMARFRGEWDSWQPGYQTLFLRDGKKSRVSNARGPCQPFGDSSAKVSSCIDGRMRLFMCFEARKTFQNINGHKSGVDFLILPFSSLETCSILILRVRVVARCACAHAFEH